MIFLFEQDDKIAGFIEYIKGDNFKLALFEEDNYISKDNFSTDEEFFSLIKFKYYLLIIDYINLSFLFNGLLMQLLNTDNIDFIHIRSKTPIKESILANYDWLLEIFMKDISRYGDRIFNSSYEYSVGYCSEEESSKNIFIKFDKFRVYYPNDKDYITLRENDFTLYFTYSELMQFIKNIDIYLSYYRRLHLEDLNVKGLI
jgi:hypothetical protein